MEQKITAAPKLSQSDAQLLHWKRAKTNIHWQLLDGSTLIGTLNWYDKWDVSVHTADLGDITLPKHSVLWYRATDAE